ncbi:T9SS type A sorting domain-containing protein [Neptunitalea lumnitzerae]|uniref:T9SS C-terminal target domain-containing protein n=1 Tax=Neptunitalea lumnitzerae TaxID=2965509 RepID=A0ABQ5MHR7_9FLAO|nr:T9SS type A sorting domain-containing protein [Neptunitalea sp. Y10]GLB48933.1 T9SS C-terminal target domain-containing protein [Neptunitalea sp. Y10]
MKKIVLLLPALLILAVTHAQLRVNDNSFVYVKDTYLYVKQDINLSNLGVLYLRNEGQLLQGTNGTSTNTGNGKISLIQEGYATQFTYNYWSSPVGSPGDEATGNARFFPLESGAIMDTTGLTTSVDATFIGGYNGTTEPLTISRLWLYKYLPGTTYSNWSFIGSSNATGFTEPGYGFSMKGTNISGNQQPYDFRGRPNDGDIYVEVKDGQETLAGNPYPSAIDLAAFLLDPDNQGKIEPSILFWEQDKTVTSHYVADYIGGYGVWVPDCDNLADCGTGVYTPATYQSYDQAGSTVGSSVISNSNYFSGRRFSPIAQGFMLEGTADTSVVFKNSYRVYYQEDTALYSIFNKEAANNQKTFTNDGTANVNTATEVVYNNGGGTETLDGSYERPKYVFQVIVNETYTRDLLLTLNDNSSLGFDYGFDGISSSGLATDAAFDIAGEDYFIQSTAFNVNEMIPLHFKTDGANSSFKILVGAYINVDSTQPVFIFDSYTGTYYQIDNNTSYTFNTTETDVTDRYFVSFSNATMSNETVLASSSINVHQNNTTHQLTIGNPNMYDLKNVSLYNMNGQVIINEQKLGAQANYSFNTSNLATGVYLVNVTTTNNQVITKKVVIKK